MDWPSFFSGLGWGLLAGSLGITAFAVWTFKRGNRG